MIEKINIEKIDIKKIQNKKICYKCSNIILKEDNFCRYCGAGQGSYVKWYYRHWGIILLMFLLGPFALIFVILSPSISTTAKWIYAFIIIGLSILLGIQFYYAYKIVGNYFNSLGNGLMFF